MMVVDIRDVVIDKTHAVFTCHEHGFDEGIGRLLAMNL